MGQPARPPFPVTELTRPPLRALPTWSDAGFRFQSLLLTEPRSLPRVRGLGLVIALLVHGILVAAAVRPKPRATAPTPPTDPARFIAPIVVPEPVVPDAGIDLGVEGGVPGGVEGGVPGGVVGGVVGGLPSDGPAAPRPAVVRVGGNLRAPKLAHDVKPMYPELAIQARLSAVVILEAHVGTDGRVQSVRILRGAPVFDDAAIEAVKQWRYQPLLLNGVPTEFILTVTVAFNLVGPTAGRQ